jgi:hypothetical protein
MSVSRFQFFRVRRAHLYQDLQGHNLPAALLLLLSFAVFHFLPLLVLALAFAGAWTLGVVTPDHQQWRFHLATAVAYIATPLLLSPLI